MSQSITIPADRGSRITVTINGVKYVYAAGETATVPDEVAAAIADMLAMDPGGTRQTAFHEEMEENGGGGGGGGGGGVDRVYLEVVYNSDDESYEFKDKTITAKSFHEMLGSKLVYIVNSIGDVCGMSGLTDEDGEYSAQFFNVLNEDAVFYDVSGAADSDEAPMVMKWTDKYAKKGATGQTILDFAYNSTSEKDELTGDYADYEVYEMLTKDNVVLRNNAGTVYRLATMWTSSTKYGATFTSVGGTDVYCEDVEGYIEGYGKPSLEGYSYEIPQD